VVALVVTFVSALTGRDPPLNAVMMLWVNLIMDTMGALALGTEVPSDTLLDRRPYKRNASLLSHKMIRHISIQSLLQIGLLLFLLVDGAAAFGVTADSEVHITIIFNTFVFSQIFNELNARSIGDGWDVLDGIFGNVYFIIVIAFTVLAQYCLVQVSYFQWLVRCSSLSTTAWYKCVLLGSLSLPVGILMRLLPIPNARSDFATQRDTPGATRVGTSKVNTMTLSLHLVLCMLSVVYSCIEFGPAWSGYLGAALKPTGLDSTVVPLVQSAGAAVYGLLEANQLLPEQVAAQAAKVVAVLL
jgi:hypothetical protein